MERVKALDGIRGIALVAVLLYHAAPDVLRGGFLGVEMFFVLSGFLLISLLLAEEDRRGLIDPWAYASRRLRRIVPALAVVLLAIVAAAPLVAPDDAHRVPMDVLSSLFGFTNWHLIADGSSYFASSGRPPLTRHLWSIAIELQVYVLIPFVAAFLARTSRRRGLAALGIAIAASATAMGLLYVSPDPSRAYFGTDARIGAMLTGAAVALIARALPSKATLTPRAKAMLCGASVVALWVLFIAADQRGRALYPAGFLAAQLATAALIVSALQPGGPATVLSDARLRWLGTRSYGIYLWHWPLVALLRPGIDVGWPQPVTKAVTIAGALVLGELSYRFVEHPFLSATGFAKRPLPKITRLSAAAWVAVIVLVAGVVSRTATVDPIAESLLAGQQAIAEQNEPGAATGGGTQAIGSGERGAAAKPVAVGELPSNKGPAPGSIKVSAVGDSVMLGGAKAMKERLGSKTFINAEVNRRWSSAAIIVRDWAHAKHLGRVLILHLGNNGPTRPEEIENVLKEAKTAEHVLLVTVRVNKPWGKATNDAVRYEAKKHAKVWMVDWHAVSSGHRDWFYSDGTHMSRKGAEAYAKLLAAKIPTEPKPTPTAPPKKQPPAPKPTPTPGLVDGVLKPE